MNTSEKFNIDDAAYKAYLKYKAARLDYTSGINADYEEDFKDAFIEGFKEGFEEGLKEGEEDALRLIEALDKAGRLDEIEKLYADKTFRENLYKEFNII